MGRRDLRSRLAALFELPGDVVSDQSRITLVGAADLVVENHRGLLEYTEERVVLMVPEGELVIGGAGLGIGSISPDQVIIRGQIRALGYSDQRGGR